MPIALRLRTQENGLGKILSPRLPLFFGHRFTPRISAKSKRLPETNFIRGIVM
jgi:hypothetical protein